jgi:AcrR family transcriptional regulator
LERGKNERQAQAVTGTILNKRDEILLEANKLFHKKGYNGTSMQDIADRVNLLKGSLYHHFSSKEELLFELINESIDRLLLVTGQIFERTDLGTREKLRELIKQHVLHLTGSNESLLIATNELDKLSEKHRESYSAKRKEYSKFWREVLEEGIQNGEFPPTDIGLTSLAIRGMINWLVEWYKQEGTYKSEYIADHFSNLVCDMMLAKIHVEKK